MLTVKQQRLIARRIETFAHYTLMVQHTNTQEAWDILNWIHEEITGKEIDAVKKGRI